VVVSGAFLVGATSYIPITHAQSNLTVETTQSQGQIEQLAKKELQQKLATIDGFSASFVQQVYDNEQQIIASGEGRLTVEKPNKVHWHTTSPDETLIIANGESLWFYDPFIEQVSVYRFKQALANTPILLLSSDEPELWQDYKVTKDETSFIIESLNEQSHVKRLHLVFSDDELAQLVIVDATGQRSEIDLKIDKEFISEATMYDFVIPEGTHVDDQRQ